MRKILLSAAIVMVGLTASAQKLTYIPWTENGYLQGTVISDNGKYVAGSDRGGQAFIYDAEKGEIKYFASPNIGVDEETSNRATVYSVTNEGLGVGTLEETATKFDFSTGKYEKLLNEHSIARYIATNGYIYGITYTSDAYERTPFQIVDGKKTDLPMATNEWLGYECDGFDIVGGNSDGSVLVGYAHDNYETNPLMIWAKNRDNTTYSLIPASRKYYDSSFELNGHQPYDSFEGVAISSNGKWIAVNLHEKNNEDGGMKIARYHVDSDSLEYISCPEADAENWYYANSISNDGTIVGYIENQVSYGRIGMICKAGETEAKHMADVFSGIKDIATMDSYDLNVPCMITPDGRYIAGFGYVDYSDTSLCYGTYIIDTNNGSTGIESIAQNNDSSKIVASYTTEGKSTRHFSGVNKSIVIDKFADGKVKKSLK